MTTLDDVMHILENHAAVHQGSALDALRLLSVGNQKMRDQYVKVVMEQWQHMTKSLSKQAIQFVAEFGNVLRIKDHMQKFFRCAHLHPDPPKDTNGKVYCARNYEGWPLIHVFVGNPRVVIKCFANQIESYVYVTFAKKIPISVSYRILLCPTKNLARSAPFKDRDPNDLYMQLLIRLQPIQKGVHVEWANTIACPHLPKHIGAFLTEDSRIISAMLTPILWVIRHIRETVKGLDIQNSSALFQTSHICWKDSRQETSFLKNHQRNLERLQELMQLT